MKKNLLGLSIVLGLSFVACNDDLNTDNYYTFTGEMMSDYITSRPQYSDFATIVQRAELMDLLSTYGHYTCFLPDNKAFTEYYKKHGVESVESLTDAECDTIARTHLVGNMYSTVEMTDGTLHTANMNRRYIQITHGLDNDSNAIVILNRASQIYYETRDDSVENGIVHPISVVLENSNASVIDIIKTNPKISIFYQALRETNLDDTLQYIRDESYDNKQYPRYYYVSDVWKEVATVPDTKKFGFTLFITPDSVLTQLLPQYGVTETGLDGLKALAKKLYDQTYPDDAGKYDDDFTNPKNPLNRYMRYCILNRDVKGWDYITTKEFHQGVVQGALGIHLNRMNPIDWYHTLLYGTMIKFEQLTMREFQGNGIMNERYANRRYDKRFQIEGAHISPTIESEYVQDAPNGRYFYVNDIVAFTPDVRDKVQNMRIRMDFSTIFPEIMTNDIRLNGDPTVDDDRNIADESFKNGRNYYFPHGFLDGVTSKGNCYFVYRRPHWNFWSYCGDEANLFGNYDFKFRLPPVPYSGEWQVRLGFCALGARGIAQIYFDDIPQGIPLDMRVLLDDESIMGSAFGEKQYTSMSDEEKAEDQKALKNKKRYRGPYGGYHSDGNVFNEFINNPRTHRVVLAQTYFDNTKDHFLRIRCASKSKVGNNNELMLDYLELVPKSVYGIVDDGEIEDDL
ncbi:MAG: fasciclin domain-containing protein [Bacteroidaceae bacterium]|nr:fasciclin domain-containing protein [Bacteroidaceae bacterium]